tara:strand:- start:242 stop:565 length:324 start_codon:yes stop_codon:yes gene_type:complete
MAIERPKAIANINVNRFIMLLKQTKIVPMADVYKIKNIIKRMNKGQKITIVQRKLYHDIATKASMNPMTNSFIVVNKVRSILKRDMKIEQIAKDKAAAEAPVAIGAK